MWMTPTASEAEGSAAYLALQGTTSGTVRLEEPVIRRFVIETEVLYPADAVKISIEEQRAFYDRLCSCFRKPRPSGIDTEDRSVPGPDGPAPIRIYRRSREIDRAMFLHLRGGGFMLGGLDSLLCRDL
jgi:acetyl esterase/lipase